MNDGEVRSITNTARVRNDGTYLAFRGRGYQVSYPVKSIASLTAVTKGVRKPQLITRPYCVNPDGLCCDPWIRCYTSPGDPVPDPPNTITIDFTLYGGTEVCDWSYTTDWIDCTSGGRFQRPHIGDGWKGNVILSFTYSISRQDAEVACNPASYTDKTKGEMEYSEFRPGQLPIIKTEPTGELEPNSEMHMHFHPALSAQSQVAGLFVFVWPAVGPAASCNKAPADLIP